MSFETPQSSAPASKSSAKTGWIVFGILAVALGLRLPDYSESIWLDELYTSNIFCGDPVILLKTLYSDIHPPFYFIFIHFWNQIFGDTEVWIRLPSLLCGLGTIVLVWRLGQLFVGRSAGLVAAGLLATSPVHIWYSQEARPYSATLFFTLATILSYYQVSQGRGIVRGLLFVVSLVCLSFTHYYNATFPCLLLLLTFFRHSPNRRRLLTVILSVLTALGLYMVAKIYFSSVPVRASYLRAFDHVEAWNLFFGWFLTGDVLALARMSSPLADIFLIVVKGLALLAFVRGIYRLVFRRRPEGAPPGIDILLQMLLLPAFLVVVTLVISNQAYIERSALPALPFFALVLATGMTGWRSHSVTRLSLGSASVVVAIFLIAFFTRGDRWTVYKPNPDWRGAAAYLAAALPADGSKVVLYSDYPSPTSLTYYDTRMQEVKNFEFNEGRIHSLFQRTVGFFGAEGFPGEIIQETIKERLGALSVRLEELKKETRLEIFELARNDPFTTSVDQNNFWLLVHASPSKRVTKILTDERFRQESERKFRSLILYKLQRVR